MEVIFLSQDCPRCKDINAREQGKERGRLARKGFRRETPEYFRSFHSPGKLLAEALSLGMNMKIPCAIGIQ